MPDITLRDLVAINLRYSAETDSYREMAYAQLAAKALFPMRGKPVKVKAIVQDISRVLGIKKAPLTEVEKGLEFLARRGLVQKDDGGWQLTPTGIGQVEREVDTATTRMSSVIRRHFPSRIDQAKLRQWMIDASTEFFGRFAEHWVAATCRGTSLGPAITENLATLLEPSIKRNGLNSEATALVSGFHQFIGSTFPEDNEQLRSFGLSMYISRLVAANVAADPITLDLIRGATLLLDTNVLIALQLEAHQLTDSFVALGIALEELGIIPLYIQKTKAEYERTILYEREKMLRVVSRYQFEVIKKSSDSFSRTAINRGCVTIPDFQRFFESVAVPPSDFGVQCKIGFLDDQEVSSVASAAELDEKLKKDIKDTWAQNRTRPKKEEALRHDAAILGVAQYLRGRDSKCLVLTLDIPLHLYCIQSSGPIEAPLSISLDAMLQILAVGMAGPQLNPTDFAPLMASILCYQFEPDPNSYTTEDLAWLMDIEERCADLPPSKTQELASKISRARIAGKCHDDKDLRLEIQRVFQGQKLKLTDDTAKATQSQLTRQVEETEKARIVTKVFKDALYEEYYGDYVSKAKRAAIFKITSSLALSGLLILLLLKIISSAFPERSIAQTLFYFVSVCGPVVAMIGYLLRHVLPEYRKRKEDAGNYAETKIQKKIGKPDAL